MHEVEDCILPCAGLVRSVANVCVRNESEGMKSHGYISHANRYTAAGIEILQPGQQARAIGSILSDKMKRPEASKDLITDVEDGI